MSRTAPSRRRGQTPRILLATPEITYLPAGMGNMANRLHAKAGGLADVSASLVAALFELGADVHVALPHYRRMFNIEVGRLVSDELRKFKSKLPEDRIHLAEDRLFYYRDTVYGDYQVDNPKLALVFQRELINNIVPRVNPDLIHCNDWMTGLIPAMARRRGIPCLFTVHNIHTLKLTLQQIEDGGIDAAEFWQYLYYESMPSSYGATRAANRVDFLASGIFGAHFVNTVSPTFLAEMCDGRHAFVPEPVRRELMYKRDADCAVGILNAPDPVYDPGTDPTIECNYTAETHVDGKCRNKQHLQERLGLLCNPAAPVFFWPSRLDPVQKGPQLLTDILYRLVSDYWNEMLQIVVVANGPYQEHFHAVVRHHDLFERVAVCDFDEGLSRLGYAAADFVLMPSRFEPCGLPQMIAPLYGALPVVHDTGGLHDTISHLDVSRNTGNGFAFTVCDSTGLRWAIDQAMAFHRQPVTVKAAQTARIMQESAAGFNHAVTAERYFDVYERMLKRPLVKSF